MIPSTGTSAARMSPDWMRGVVTIVKGCRPNSIDAIAAPPSSRSRTVTTARTMPTLEPNAAAASTMARRSA